jgi:hypothetical protein
MTVSMISFTVGLAVLGAGPESSLVGESIMLLDFTGHAVG